MSGRNKPQRNQIKIEWLAIDSFNESYEHKIKNGLSIVKKLSQR